jgi:hypothetical protein
MKEQYLKKAAHGTGLITLVKHILKSETVTGQEPKLSPNNCCN